MVPFSFVFTARAEEAHQKFSQLRDVYQKLRGDHIQLLRVNGDIKKKLESTDKSIKDEGEARKVS